MTLKGARVLVTGGAGFIGSHIVDDLVSCGCEVVVYDDFSTGLMENLAQHEGKIKVINADILDQGALRSAMLGIDFVSHQAAQLEIFRSTSDPEADLLVNTTGTLRVLQAAKEAAVKKVVNASSACVYGQVEGLTDESCLPFPNWAYGVSKLAAERYGQVWNDSQGLPVCSLRYAIVYGNREWYRRVLTIFLKRATEGLPPVVFGDGVQVRDFVHVSDVVRLNRMCMEQDAANGKIFNVGTGVGTSMVELARLVADMVGTSVLHEQTAEGAFSTLIPDKRRNAAELQVMLLNPSYATATLGWKPLRTLRDGVSEELSWARENKHRWTKIRYTETAAAATLKDDRR
jgi:UDP-glucose 4-epimerase